MKKLILSVVCMLSLSAISFAQEFKVVTIVESIVPGGLGRSRIIENKGEVNINDVTTQREGNKSNSGSVKRTDLKEEGDNLLETKLLNFYSFAGINFSNVATNDAIITAKINDLVKQGWKVAHIASGVESDAGKSDGYGIFITRIYLTK
jgi:hypothetical protein